MKKFHFFKKKKSGNIAKDRLKILLISDRINCSPQTLDLIKQELIHTISNIIVFVFLSNVYLPVIIDSFIYLILVLFILDILLLVFLAFDNCSLKFFIDSFICTNVILTQSKVNKNLQKKT